MCCCSVDGVSLQKHNKGDNDGTEWKSKIASCDAKKIFLFFYDDVLRPSARTFLARTDQKSARAKITAATSCLVITRRRPCHHDDDVIRVLVCLRLPHYNSSIRPIEPEQRLALETSFLRPLQEFLWLACLVQTKQETATKSSFKRPCFPLSGFPP